MLHRSRCLLAALFSATVALTGSVQSQGLNQLGCRVVVERNGERVSVFAVAQVTQPARVDYTLKSIKISASGTGAVEQSGSERMNPGETQVLSQTSFGMEEDGWYEFELEVQEQLTGVTCTANEIVSPV